MYAGASLNNFIKQRVYKYANSIHQNMGDIPIETAHGGSGSRQVILSKSDPVSTKLEAMTKGFLPAGKAYDWHGHDNIDEFWLVLKGTGIIEYATGECFQYKPQDVIYNPANINHKIENTGIEESEFYFIRIAE